MENQTGFPENRFVVYERLVKISFAFLTEDYGFWLANIEKLDDQYITVKYLSEKVFLNLYYGSPSFELDFNIGRVGIEDKSEDEGFTSGDLIGLGNDKRWENYKLFAAHSCENLQKSLPKLAELLRVFGVDFLNGDALSYEKALFKKAATINHWYDKQELKQAKKAASVAWKNKDYAKVIEVLEPVVNALSPSEKNKLEYARKHT